MTRRFDSPLNLGLAALLCAALPGCGSIDPPPAVDEKGDVIPTPRPFEKWLRFTEITPADEIPLRPTIKIEFNDYLDPTTFNSFSSVQLASGGYVSNGQIDYWITQRALYFRPASALEPDLLYELRLPGSKNLRSAAGSPLHPDLAFPTMHARQELEPAPAPTRPLVTWEEVKEIFDASCNSCHGDPSWGLPQLTPQGLVGAPSEQVDAALVEPFAPAHSYLMHKILPDYPKRRFTAQPPPWSDASPLNTDEIELIEHWIAHGAPGSSHGHP